MEQQEIVRGRLGGIELLGCLSAPEIEAVERACTWRRYQTGQQVLTRESASRDVFFVAEGAVEIINFSASGREIAFATLPAGAYFGEISAIDGERRSANVVAAKSALLASLNPTAFHELLGKHPPMALHVLKRLARIIRICDDRIMDLATLGAVQRVQVEILRLARPDPAVAGAWLVYPVPTQQEIANRAATTRETVARVLGQLQAGGLIRRKGKTLYFADLERLRRLADRLATEAEPR